MDTHTHTTGTMASNRGVKRLLCTVAYVGVVGRSREGGRERERRACADVWILGTKAVQG